MMPDNGNGKKVAERSRTLYALNSAYWISPPTGWYWMPTVDRRHRTMQASNDHSGKRCPAIRALVSAPCAHAVRMHLGPQR